MKSSLEYHEPQTLPEGPPAPQASAKAILHQPFGPMKAFPYITDYVNQTFDNEQTRWDYIFLRPILVVLYFFIRTIAFPLKFVVHRNPYGFEGRCIDGTLAFGMKYLATSDAVELVVRHVQIEPLLYRHFLGEGSSTANALYPRRKFNGIDGDYNMDSLRDIIDNNLTVGHDELSYEFIDRFNKDQFLANIGSIRSGIPDDHMLLSKKAMEATREHSMQWLGCTNVVIMIVIVITIFADLRTTVKALNSFDSDSVLLWIMKHLYAQDQNVLTDLDFYVQADANGAHYNSSAFFSNPSLYLHGHIAFDEYAYHTLRNHPPTTHL